VSYEADGDASGLAISGDSTGAGVASVDSTALAAAEAAAEAEVSGAVLVPSSDLLQARPTNIIASRVRTRYFRIISSFRNRSG